jgi:hypothetical protein
MNFCLAGYIATRDYVDFLGGDWRVCVQEAASPQSLLRPRHGQAAVGHI